MYKEYYYCVDFHNVHSQELIARLEAAHIKYDLEDEPIGNPNSMWSGLTESRLCTFTLKSRTELNDFVEKNFRKSPIVTNVYSKQEVEQAPFLWVVTKRHSVEPAKDLEEFVPDQFCFNSRGQKIIHTLKQLRPIAVSRVPSMKGNFPFWTDTLDSSILYTSQRVKDLVEENHLMGIQFVPVTYCNGTPRPEGLYQILSVNHIHEEDIVPGSLPDFPQLAVCPNCGFRCFQMRNDTQLHLKTRAGGYPDDFYLTDPLFGPEGEFGPLFTPISMISQRFYQTLKKNRLTSSVWFWPVPIEK